MNPPPQRSYVWLVLQCLAAILMRVLYDIRVTGLHNVPGRGGVLIVSNHQSYLDPVIIGVMLDRPLAFLASAHLFKFKPFAMLIRKLNAFPIEQGRGDVGAVKQSIRLLQEGQVLNVFPEGTRTPNGDLQPVQGGIAIVIRRAKVPVVPTIITGAYEAWPRSRKLPRPGRVRIHYGEPMRLDHLSGDEIVQSLESALRRMFEQA